MCHSFPLIDDRSYRYPSSIEETVYSVFFDARTLQHLVRWPIKLEAYLVQDDAGIDCFQMDPVIRSESVPQRSVLCYFFISDFLLGGSMGQHYLGLDCATIIIFLIFFPSIKIPDMIK